MSVINSTRDVSKDGISKQANSESTVNLKVYVSRLHENIKKIGIKKEKTN